MTQIRTYWDDDVDGIIIGQMLVPYEFWIDEPRPGYADKNGKRRVAKSSFENDEQAVAWFKENYPAEFKQGVEMRCWDKD